MDKFDLEKALNSYETLHIFFFCHKINVYTIVNENTHEFKRTHSIL